MTKLQQADKEITREEYLEHAKELEQAWKELDEAKTKINKLDIENAHLKDERAKLEQQNTNLFERFKELLGMYQVLYDQVISSNTALTITSGKLAETLVRTKFTIPQQEQPST